MTFPLPALSKFNKRYVNGLLSNLRIPFIAEYYAYIETDQLSVLQNFHKYFRPDSIERQSDLHFSSFTQTKKEKIQNKVSEIGTQKRFIYPFKLSQLIEDHFSIYPLSEVDFVFNYYISTNRIIRVNDNKSTEYLLIKPNPFNKEEYTSLKQEYDSKYSFKSIQLAIMNVADVTARYKKDYEAMLIKLEKLNEENISLKNQICSMNEQIIKSNSYTWQ